MGETPVFMAMVPQTTVDKKGKNPSQFKQQSQHITSVFCCTALGKFLLTMIIFKGRTQRVLRGVTPQSIYLCNIPMDG